MDRRVPPSLSAFVAGTAGRIWDRIWPPAAALLTGIQGAIDAEDRPAESAWLAGGVVRAAVLGGLPRDVDVFFASSKVLRIAVARLAANYDHCALGETEVCLKFRVLLPGVATWTEVDFVKRYAGTPIDCARAMDFTACAAAVSTSTYARHVDFEEHARAQKIEVCAPRAPRASLRRAERFAQRGWTISSETMARLKELAEAQHLPEWDFANKGDRPEGRGWDYDER